MAAPKPGNTERGWNDPPLFDYQSSNALQKSNKRTNLNKRVAYPLSSSQQCESKAVPLLNPSEAPPQQQVQLLPPASSTSAPTPVPLLIPHMVTPLDEKKPPTTCPRADSAYKTLENALKGLEISCEAELLDLIINTLHADLNSCKSSFSERSFDDIKKKIQTLKEVWDSGKLSEVVKCRMCSIAEAMKAKDYEQAWSLHLTLMVDYTAEVNVWLVGIKRIIHEFRKNSDNKDDNITSDPLILVSKSQIGTDISQNCLNLSPENSDSCGSNTDREISMHHANKEDTAKSTAQTRETEISDDIVNTS